MQPAQAQSSSDTQPQRRRLTSSDRTFSQTLEDLEAHDTAHLHESKVSTHKACQTASDLVKCAII